MPEVFDLTCYACLLLPESKLSQSNHAYHSFVPKLCHHRGKNTAALKNLNHTEISEFKLNVNLNVNLNDNLDRLRV